MSDEQIAPEAEAQAVEEAPQYGIGPFTLREVVLGGVWLIAFVVSFFPLYAGTGLGGQLVGGPSVWTAGLDWILTIGVPTVAVFLLVLRRLSPEGIRRVGSLGIDQFASVAFTVSATTWLVALWNTVSLGVASGLWVRTWVVWIEFFLMLAALVLTVLAPHIPPFSQDFEGRPDAAAHRNARPVRAVVARPRPEPVPAPVEVDPYAPVDGDLSPFAATGPIADSSAAPTADDATGEWVPHYARSVADDDEGGYRRTGEVLPTEEPVDADPFAALAGEPEVAPESEAASAPVADEPARAAHQAFWALAPEERDVHDESGLPIFRVGPTAWALVIEDRGSLFVIRHEDGRIGYLHDVTGVTRG